MSKDYYVLVRAHMDNGVLTTLRNKDDNLDIAGFFPAIGYKVVPLEPTEYMKKGNDWMDVNVYKLFVNRAPKIEDIQE